MTKVKNRKWMKSSVILNFGSLAGATAIASVGEAYSWNSYSVGLLLLLLISYAVSFYLTQIRTGLWRFIHRKVEKLDEREHQISYEALRVSYSTFTIAAIILLMLVMLSDESSVTHWFQWVRGRPLFLAMMLFAHSLPAALLAWKSEVL